MANRSPNRRGIDSRSKLLEAGMAEFHQRGYAATGVDVVARRAQVPKGSFYNHFGSKQAYAAEVVDRYFERHLVKLREFLVDNNSSPMTRLRSYFDERTAFFQELGGQRGCMMGNLTLEAADESDLLRKHLAEHFATWSGMLAACISEAQTAGEIKSTIGASVLADFVLNSWEGALLRMKSERSIKPLEDAKAIIFGLVLS